jgi:GINS complex subunit 3
MLGIVFQAGRDSMTAFKKWRLEGTRMERATILGKKRKPLGENM